MTIKPHVVFFSDEEEMADLLSVHLSGQFEVTPVSGVAGMDEALVVLRQIRPDYVIVDPLLANLDHQQLHRRLQADPDLKGIQMLVVRDDQMG